MTYNESVTIDETDGNVFYIPVPAQTYTNLTIVLDADGTGTTTSCMIVKDGTATVERSKLYSVEFEVTVIGKGTAKATINSVETDVNWVQLWEGGPMFAEYNIGATSETDCGGYYCWGKSIDKDPYWAYNEEGEVLSGDDDTATKLWGSNWRMPIKEELFGLIDYCNFEWTTLGGVNGLKFTGKGDYSTNSIFLPTASVDLFFYYTTSSQFSYHNDGKYDYVNALAFSKSTGPVRGSASKTQEISVRPVYVGN